MRAERREELFLARVAVGTIRGGLSQLAGHFDQQVVREAPIGQQPLRLRPVELRGDYGSTGDHVGGMEAVFDESLLPENTDGLTIGQQRPVAPDLGRASKKENHPLRFAPLAQDAISGPVVVPRRSAYEIVWNSCKERHSAQVDVVLGGHCPGVPPCHL